jgi:hypothetical protein
VQEIQSNVGLTILCTDFPFDCDFWNGPLQRRIRKKQKKKEKIESSTKKEWKKEEEQVNEIRTGSSSLAPNAVRSPLFFAMVTGSCPRISGFMIFNVKSKKK